MKRTLDLVLVDAALLVDHFVLVVNAVAATLEPRLLPAHAKVVTPSVSKMRVTEIIISDVLTYAVTLQTEQRTTQVSVGIPYVVHGE